MLTPDGEGGGGGALPYVRYKCMCRCERCERYDFQAVSSLFLAFIIKYILSIHYKNTTYLCSL